MIETGGTDGVDVAIQQWWLAWETKDLDAIVTLAHPDYFEFTGHSAEHRVGRETLAIVARRAFGAFSIRAWELGRRRAMRFGDVAIVAYSWKQRTEADDQVMDSTGVATDILVRQDRRWRYLAHHSSTVSASTDHS